MASFIRRFNKMQTLSKLVVVSTVGLQAAAWALIVAGSPLALPVLLSALLPLPAGLVYERIRQG